MIERKFPFGSDKPGIEQFKDSLGRPAEIAFWPLRVVEAWIQDEKMQLDAKHGGHGGFGGSMGSRKASASSRSLVPEQDGPSSGEWSNSDDFLDSGEEETAEEPVLSTLTSQTENAERESE